MKIARMAAPIHSLGPGERLCLWVQGCNRQCPGCISPELQAHTKNDADENLLAELVLKVASNAHCTGLTISGGEPFEQSDSLLKFLKLVRNYFSDILVYSGYTIEEILSGCSRQSGVHALGLIDVLIDGSYIEDLNFPDCVLRGSKNQRIHYLSSSVKDSYLQYMMEGRQVETYSHDGNIVIAGIMNRSDAQ